MLTIEERIMRSKERTKRLEIERKLKIKQEEEAKRKLDMRRYSFSGKLMEEHFPAISMFQPQRSEAESKTEFALLDIVLSLLAEDEDYVSQLVERAKVLLQQQS